MVSNSGKKKILIFGLGTFGKRLLVKLIKNWEVIGVDIDEKVIDAIKTEFPEEKNLQLINGDASSILTWKKIEIESVKHIVSTIRDIDISLEICRITREVFNLDASMIILLFEESYQDEFEKFNVAIVKPVEIITDAVLSKIEKNYTIATNIGLGKGEIIEVHILARSHLVDRKLKYLKPTRWRIAAIYRDNELIIPTGNEKIKVGDRVVIIGDPKVLENLVNILIKGIPQFPLQFGADFATVYHPKFKKSFEETVYFKKNTKAHKLLIFPYKRYNIYKDFEYLKSIGEIYEIKESVRDYTDLFKYKNSIGIVSIPFIKEPIFKWFKLKSIFKNATKPFLISRGNFPYKGIVVSLNCPEPAFTIEMGLEISRLMKLPVEIVYGVMPEELRSLEEENALKERNEIVSDFEHIYKTGLKYSVLEGNPVRETVKYMKDKKEYLFLTSYDKKEEISLFHPNIPFHIVKNIKSSSICFPLEEHTYE